jgi:type IV pilus assembly protein PilA
VFQRARVRVARRTNQPDHPESEENIMTIRQLRKQLRNSRGFTLVELMIVVAIVGILAALAIYGVRKYMSNAKSAEARNGIGQMGKDAITAYAREGMAPAVLALGDSAGVSNRLCKSAISVPGGITTTLVGATPATEIAGQKYQSAPSEWSTGAKDAGWTCVKFSMNDPHYYMYQYSQTGDETAAGGEFQAQAMGDLDGDGVGSLFSLKGSIVTDAGGTVAILAPNMDEVQPEE